MNSIKISTPEELIQFMENTNLLLNDYVKIITSYFNQRLLFYPPENKGELINFVNKCIDHKLKGWDLPLSIEQKGKHFNIRDLYNIYAPNARNEA